MKIGEIETDIPYVERDFYKNLIIERLSQMEIKDSFQIILEETRDEQFIERILLNYEHEHRVVIFQWVRKTNKFRIWRVL